ncbi:hypothetical protein MMPV_002739 [Pyropia vietnamensis]
MPHEMVTGPVETPAVVDDGVLDPYSTYTLRAPDQRAWSPVARLAKAPDLAPTRLRFTRVGARRPSRQSMLPARLPPRPPSDQSMEPVRLPSPPTAAPAEERAPAPTAASTRSSSGSGKPKMSQSSGGPPSSGRSGGGCDGGHADDAVAPGCKGGARPHRGLRGLLSSLTRSKAAARGDGKRKGFRDGADPRGDQVTITAVMPAPSRAVAQLDGRLSDRGAVSSRAGSPPMSAAQLTSERLAAVGALDLGAASAAATGRAKWAAGGGAPILQGRCSVDGPGRVMGGRSSVEFRVPAAGAARGAPPPALMPPVAAPSGRAPKRGAPKRETPAAHPIAPAHRGKAMGAAAAAAAAAGGQGSNRVRPAGGPRGGVVLGGRSSLDGRAIAAAQAASARAAVSGPASGTTAGRGHKGAKPAAGGKAGTRRRK